MSVQQYEQFVSNDMAMVAYLSLMGHTSQSVSFENDVCRWHFVVVGDFMRCVEDFLNDKASVNPREYNRHFANAKREFHNIMDEHYGTPERQGRKQ